MAKKTPATTKNESDAYLSAADVAKALGITIEEHHRLTGSPGYPKAMYSNPPDAGVTPVFLGYLASDLEAYMATPDKSAEQQAPEKGDEKSAADALDEEFEEEFAAAIGFSMRDVQIPTGDLEHTRSLSFSSGFSAQWSADEMLRLKKLIAGLVRAGETYVDYSQSAEKRRVLVRSNIQNALKWLLRKCVPLTMEELTHLNLQHKAAVGEVEALATAD